uniref:BZIP domain-containing protein n=1 Tax=Davidia involucrata TaxID=16924 RepID=A0A5B6YWW2_DAVIN
MESSNKLLDMTNFLNMSRQTLLPPLSPYPHVSPSYADCTPVGSQGISKLMEEQSHHHRCSSGGFLIEESPSWLEDLLNESETQVLRGHRRSSSDSLAYLGTAAKTLDMSEEHKLKNFTAGPFWGSQNFVHHKDTWHASLQTKTNSSDKQHHRVNESSLKSVTCSGGLSSTRDGSPLQTPGSSCALLESDGMLSTAIGKCDQEETGSQKQEGSTERSECSQAKPSVSKTDAKRAKQQSAHRSRVRKLQYITELERNIQILQVEGSEVSAQLEFLDQQNLILGMENRALRQRLDSLAQEQLIKQLEQDMLEREIGRLQTLYQFQMQQQQQLSKHCRAKSRDHDSQFTNLSSKHKEPGSTSGSGNGSVHM